MSQIHAEPGFAHPASASMKSTHREVEPAFPHVSPWACAQLRDGGPGHQSDKATVASEGLTGDSETSLWPGQTHSVWELKQAVLNGGDKSAAPGSQGRRSPALG